MVTFTCLRSDEPLLGRLSKADQWVSSDGRTKGETGLGRDGQRAWASIKVGPKVWLIRKDPGKDWRREEKETTEDEMVGWHHRLNGHEFEQSPGIGEGQGSLVCSCPWGHEESDTTEQLNWTELNCNQAMAGFPGGLAIKNSPAMWLSFLGKEDPLEKEMAAHCSILAWEIPWIQEPSELQSIGSQNSWTWLGDWRTITTNQAINHKS